MAISAIDYSRDWCVLCNVIASKRCRDYHSSCIETPWQPGSTDVEMAITVSQKDIQRANGLHTPLCYPIQRLICKPWIIDGGQIIRYPGQRDRWEWVHLDRTALLLLWKWTIHQHISPTNCKVWIPERFVKA